MEEKKHAPKSNGFHDPSEEVSDDEGSPCGVMGCNPAPMQSLRKPVVVLIFLSITAFMQGFVVNGLVNVVTTSLERRFSLSSAASGLVSSCYDIGYLLCTVPVAYFGGRKGSSKPRWLGAGILLIALGSFLFALPHFLIPTYSPKLPTEGGQNNDTVTEDELCVDDRESQDKCTFQEATTFYSEWKWCFYAAQVLHGIGATPIYTLGISMLEENIPSENFGLYMAFFYFMATVGPGVGFFFGAYQLNLHTNFLELDDSKINITSSSSLWVGAWWLGFALNAVFALVVSIPVFALPANLPGSKAMRAARVNEVHHGQPTTKDSGNEEKEGFLIQLRRLLLNPVYMFLMAAGTFEIALTVGGTTFAGKLNETNYGFSASEAAFLLGSVTMPVIGGMTLLGGYVVKRFALSVKQIIKLCVVTSFIALALNSGYLFTCPQETIIGINGEYNTGGSSFHLDSGSRSLLSPCNIRCGCREELYTPVCGNNGNTYFSPCYAGCHNGTEINSDTTNYTNCATICNIDFATSGKCSRRECPSYYFFLQVATLTLAAGCTIMLTSPSTTATVRCVQEVDRPLALGLMWIFFRILGSIPAPLLYGALLDKTCLFWETDCSGAQGSCILYNIRSEAWTFFSLAIVFKVVSGTSYMLAAFLYRAPKEDPKGTDAQHDVISASEASLTTPPENYHVETDSLYTKL